MAASTSSNSSRAAPQLVMSPSPSASTTALLQSQPGSNYVLQSSTSVTVQGAPTNDDAPLRPIKLTVASRISGMFNRKRGSSIEPSHVSLYIKSIDGKAGNTSATSRPAPLRWASLIKSKLASAPYSQIWMNCDGTHKHHIKVTKRKGKTADMLQKLMLGKKKNGHNKEQPLTLLLNWVDGMRNKEGNLAKRENSTGTSETLVQKYGKCQEAIGRGAFGTVRVAHKANSKDPQREQLYAMKELKQRPGESVKGYEKRLTAEFCISSSMQHPNVITTLNLLQNDRGVYCQVMEYCSGGDLHALVLAAGRFDVMEADCFFKQLMRGVEYMHEMGVAHRDLKPENLLLTQHGSIKIIDFGNADCFRMAWETEAHMTTGVCGSAPYIAPEEYVEKKFDARAVDVWACGMIYMAMRTGRYLWRVAQKGKDGSFERYLEDCKGEAGYKPIEVLSGHQRRNVIYSTLNPKPTCRLTAHQVLSSEWVKKIKVCRAGNEGF